eukprot:4815597-Amphidinium_carterae.1
MAIVSCHSRQPVPRMSRSFAKMPEQVAVSRAVRGPGPNRPIHQSFVAGFLWQCAWTDACVGEGVMLSSNSSLQQSRLPSNM